MPEWGLCSPPRVDRALLQQSAATVAPQLLGLYLVHETAEGRTVGRIVETEAYSQDDPAAHTHRGETRRNRAMFGPAGHAYIYQMHGHHCVNCTAGQIGYGSGCLLRALEPVAGLDLMRLRRGAQDERALCSGPGKLAKAMGITMDQYGLDLLDADSPLRLEPPQTEADFETVQTTRIGISRAQEVQWRFYIQGNAHLSRKRVGT